VKNKTEDEVVNLMIEIMRVSSDHKWEHVMEASVMHIVAMCMQGGAQVDELEPALTVLNELFKHNWKTAFAVRAHFIAPAGHA
jgi:hypothetical protein